MKNLSHLSVATAAAFALVFFAAPRAGAQTKETRLGPFSAQKVALAKHVGGARQAESDNPNEPPTIAIVLVVEQKMTGNQQEITARISAHREGPGGTLVGVEGLRVHVTQPGDFGTEPRPQKTGEARITKTFSAPGGKYKTVVAEGSIASPRYTDVKFSLTIPGN